MSLINSFLLNIPEFLVLIIKLIVVTITQRAHNFTVRDTQDWIFDNISGAIITF